MSLCKKVFLSLFIFIYCFSFPTLAISSSDLPFTAFIGSGWDTNAWIFSFYEGTINESTTGTFSQWRYGSYVYDGIGAVFNGQGTTVIDLSAQYRFNSGTIQSDVTSIPANTYFGINGHFLFSFDDSFQYHEAFTEYNFILYDPTTQTTYGDVILPGYEVNTYPDVGGFYYEFTCHNDTNSSIDLTNAIFSVFMTTDDMIPVNYQTQVVFADTYFFVYGDGTDTPDTDTTGSDTPGSDTPGSDMPGNAQSYYDSILIPSENATLEVKELKDKQDAAEDKLDDYKDVFDSVTTPDISEALPDYDEIFGNNYDQATVSNFFNVFYENDTVITLFLMVTALILISFILFGKKG